MRVIAGTVRGKKLETCTGDDVRPTSDRVKEAIFSILQQRLDGANFLDLFAGSGQMGLEALSRGAALAVLVDQSSKSIDIIRKNVVNCQMESKVIIEKLASSQFLEKNHLKFDIAFLDPPYRRELLLPSMELLSSHLADSAIVLCEHARDEILPDRVLDLIKQKEYRYGQIVVTSYHK